MPICITIANGVWAWRGEGQILGFSIDLLRRPYNTLALPCECVIILLLLLLLLLLIIFNDREQKSQGLKYYCYVYFLCLLLLNCCSDMFEFIYADRTIRLS